MVFGQTLFADHITGASRLNYTDVTTIASLFNEYHVYAAEEFLIGAQLRKDLEKEYADTKAVLVDLGMAR
jgi:hypothetical protein